MPTALVIQAHQPYPFSPGRLNQTLADLATSELTAVGWTVRTTASAGDYDVDEELAKHTQADVVIVQSPVNWMGVSWSFKKYMDAVYTAGMDRPPVRGRRPQPHRPEPPLRHGGDPPVAAVPDVAHLQRPGRCLR